MKSQCQLFAPVLCWLVLAHQPGVLAQDEEEQERSPRESLEDIRSQQKKLERDADFLAGQQESVRKQIAELKTIEAAQQELVAIQGRIEAAEDDEDKELLEQLEERFELAQFQQEQRLELFEVSEEVREVHRELHDVQQEGHREIATQLTQILTLVESRRLIIRRLFEAFQKDDEAAAGLLELRLERIGEEVDLRREIIELHYELAGVRDEEDLDEVRELEEGLKELDAELKGVLERGKTRDRRRTQTELKPALPANQSILIDDSALAAVSNLTERHIGVLLKKFCFDCHGEQSATGDLSIETLLRERPFVRNRQSWINVLEQTRNRVMPPEDADAQPTDKERQLIAAWLHRTINDFDYETVSEPGFEPVRRLTHYEYNNTIRDLFGIDLRPADQFPDDLSASSGFDNSANSLFIQPILMERYLGAAEATISQALPERPKTDALRKVRARIYVNSDGKTENDRAKAILGTFASRAYRRNISEKEVSKLVAVFEAARKEGASFQDAIKESLAVVLISADFLFHIEADQNTSESWQISGNELANRLSYFLWASMPDEVLTVAGRNGELEQSDALLKHVDRMLASEKADTLGSIFASQWLGFQHLGTRVRAGPIDNPWCTDSLMDAMKAESAMFFMSVLREDQPVSRLIDARYTFLNEELARFYQMNGVRGPHMRRVSLSADNPRGGIFGHGSVLAVTSFPGRTSPVVRGRWILADVLGTPPPPPPPNVSELDDEVAEARNLTFRQKLEVHRKNPSCAACHSQIDPLGFALENFDWFGRWKANHRGKPIDAKGQLPDGTTFNGPAEMKAVLVETRLDELTTQLTRKMLSYALGRQLEYYDEATVRRIVKSAQQDNYRMRTVVREIVLSKPFRWKKKRSTKPAGSTAKAGSK